MTRSAHPSPHDDPAVRRALSALGNDARSELAIGGIPTSELIRAFGSPLYAFDGDALRARAREVRAAFGPSIRILYSIKANPSVALTSILREEGCGAEIASLGELAVARAAGHAAQDLRFAGPGKSRIELESALRQGLGVFHVESESEARDLAALAQQASDPIRVALRVNLTRRSHGGRLRMAGTGSRFGVDETRALELLRELAAEPRLQLTGLHAYSGTQCFAATDFLSHAEDLCSLADDWEQELAAPLSEIDLGGGFGVATYLGDPFFDLSQAAAGLRELLAAPQRAQRTHMVELGRFLTAPCGVYLATVTRAKQSGEASSLALDGGMHHCAIGTGGGSVLRRPPLLVHAGALDQAPAELASIGGPLCTPHDQFAEAIWMPRIREGDVLALLNAGAYGLTYSPTGFLSHASAAEVLIEGGKARIIRQRGSVDDALRGQLR